MPFLRKSPDIVFFYKIQPFKHFQPALSVHTVQILIIRPAKLFSHNRNEVSTSRTTSLPFQTRTHKFLFHPHSRTIICFPGSCHLKNRPVFTARSLHPRKRGPHLSIINHLGIRYIINFQSCFYWKQFGACKV